MPDLDLLIPIKGGATTKSRFAFSNQELRERLMSAFVRDALQATCAVPGLQVFVVGTPQLVSGAVRGFDVEVLDDGGSADLNTALTFAEREVATGGRQVAVMLGDLPSLRAADLSAALLEAGPARSFVADADGTGTTLLIGQTGARLDPRFGPNSALAHELSGARRIGDHLASLRRDVDVPDDLDDAVRIGVGPATTALISHGPPLSRLVS